MKLTLSPEQFLAVYNCVTVNQGLTAQEVKSKMDLVLLDALSSIDEVQNQSKFSHWAKQEEDKISNLQHELKTISKSSIT
jgi:hypothetical protein